MKGNFSRLTRGGGRPSFSSVLLQQGRVLLDSDWNDLVAIFDRQLRATTQAIIGREGGPAGDAGFALELDCGLALNGGGQTDQQYGQSVVLERRGSLPFRYDSADLPYTIEVELRVPTSGCCGEAPRAVLLELPGRWTIYVQADLCLTLCGPDDRELQKLGKLEPDVNQSVLVSYDGQRTVHVWVYRRGGDRQPRRDQIEFAGWSGPNRIKSSLALAIAANQASEANLRCTCLGSWIWDAEFEQAPLASVRTNPSKPGCRLVCDLDLCAITPEPGELGLAVIADASGKQNRGWIRLRSREQNLPPVRLLGLEIGAGRYFVAGLDVANHEPVGFANQPWAAPSSLPNPPDPPDAAYLFYLEVWERFVSALQYPEIVEPALGGPDTTARTQTIWQVRCALASNASELDRQWDARRARQDDPGRARFFRAKNELGQAGNKLYRAEIHHPGWSLAQVGTPATSSPITIDQVSSNSITISNPEIASMLAFAAPVALWPEAGPSDSAPFLTYVTCIEDGCRAELARLPTDVSVSYRLQPIATFKWSRDNGALAFPVQSVAAATAAPPAWIFTLANAGYDGFDIAVGDWLELVDDASELAHRGGLWFQILAIDSSTLQITASPMRTLPELELGSNPVLRCWNVSSQTGDATSIPPIPPLSMLDGDHLLEQAIEIGFAGAGFYASGDWWVVPVRDEVGDGLLWPKDRALPPQGIVIHRAKLARLQVGLGKAACEDLRTQFVPLTTRPASDPGAATATDPDSLAALIDGLFERAWAGRARILVEGPGDLPGLEDTGARVEARNVTGSSWRSRASSDAPKGSGLALIWQQRPVFLADSGQVARLDETGSWQALASFDKRSDFAAAACGGRLWLFGGRGRTAIATIQWLEAGSAGAWQVLAGLELDPPAAGLAAVSLAGRIHVIGGATDDGATQAIHRVFDPRTPSSWQTAAPLSIARKDFALVAHEGLLYAIGGRDSTDAAIASVECWEPDSDSWTTLAPVGEVQLPALADLAAVSVPEGLIVAGGHDDAAQAGAWLFRPGLRRWQPLADLQSPRYRLGLVATREWCEPEQPAVYAIGGLGERGAVRDVEALALAQSFRVLRSHRDQDPPT